MKNRKGIVCFNYIKIYFYFFILAKRRKRSKARWTFRINKYHVWIGFMLLGAIFFFAKKFAPDAPVLWFLSKWTAYAFWETWLLVFFVLCFLVWLFIILKGYLMKTLIKQFVCLMLLTSWVLNFQAIEEWWQSLVNRAQSVHHWWYFSWPLYRILEHIFWQSKIAIQILLIVMLIWVVIRILYALNVTLPKLPKINVEREAAPERKPAKVPHVTLESTTSDSEIMKKLQQATWKKTASVWTWSKVTWTSSSGSLLMDWFGSMFKEKVKHKMEEKEQSKPRPQIHFSGDKPTFPTSLLESNLSESQQIDEKAIVEKAQPLQNKLAEFWIYISIEWFDIGPSVVQIRIKLAEWIKISAVTNLMDNIKLSLRTRSVRMVAPIPWTDCIWIQIPNPKPKIVCLWDILSSREFQKWMQKSETTLALWKWIDGAIAISQLDSMPHLLVAWATWSWKSVGINNFILSLMYQNSPSELKFLMVDPKQVELWMYSWLPYLLAPIVYDSWKAVKLLQRTEQEMERRYTILSQKQVKQLSEFNAAYPYEKIYRIVFIIDEMADMMMSSASNRKEAERCINRIAAKARAVWIHLILATQRPSVNVITWLIKANIPARIAFSVVSEVDSRTILWHKWAEELVWRWDMLYMDAKITDLRVQWAFVDTKEIDAVVEHLKQKYMVWLSEDDVYNQEIINALESKAETWWAFSWWWSGNWDDEDLITQAIQIIAETRKASTTMIQRKLWIWFARAARIMDTLEERGIVWPQDGARWRDIFI